MSLAYFTGRFIGNPTALRRDASCRPFSIEWRELSSSCAGGRPRKKKKRGDDVPPLLRRSGISSAFRSSPFQFFDQRLTLGLLISGLNSCRISTYAQPKFGNSRIFTIKRSTNFFASTASSGRSPRALTSSIRARTAIFVSKGLRDFNRLMFRNTINNLLRFHQWSVAEQE